MSNFSGISAVLTVSLVAIVTIQMLKDNFMMVENYGEHDDNGDKMDYMNPYTTRDVSDSQNVGQVVEQLPVHNQDLSNVPAHGLAPFFTGDFFTGPYVQKSDNGWNGFAESYAMYQNQVMSATPTVDQLNLIGSTTNSLSGPNNWTQDSYASANVNTGRASNLTLCAQNANTFDVGNSAIASSLLPNPKSNTLEGFSDCDVTNSLANQVFLTQAGGTNTIGGSLKNSNVGLRSEPPNPKLNVSPWLNSTIYPDLTRRPLEGCGPSFGLYGNGPYGSGTPTSIKP